MIPLLIPLAIGGIAYYVSRPSYRPLYGAGAKYGANGYPKMMHGQDVPLSRAEMASFGASPLSRQEMASYGQDPSFRKRAAQAGVQVKPPTMRATTKRSRRSAAERRRLARKLAAEQDLDDEDFELDEFDIEGEEERLFSTNLEALLD